MEVVAIGEVIDGAAYCAGDSTADTTNDAKCGCLGPSTTAPFKLWTRYLEVVNP